MGLKAEHLKRKEVCFYCKHYHPYAEWGTEEKPVDYLGWCDEFAGEDLAREFYCRSFERSEWSKMALEIESAYKAA